MNRLLHSYKLLICFVLCNVFKEGYAFKNKNALDRLARMERQQSAIRALDHEDDFFEGHMTISFDELSKNNAQQMFKTLVVSSTIMMIGGISWYVSYYTTSS